MLEAAAFIIVRRIIHTAIHVGGQRQTVMDYAKSVSPAKAIGSLSLKDVTFVAPKDTSLDTSRYDSKISE